MSSPNNRDPKGRPGLRMRYGYPLAGILVLGMVAGLIAVSQNHGWIPERDRPATAARAQ